MKIVKKTIVDEAVDTSLEDKREMLNETVVESIMVDGEFEDVRIERRYSQIKVLNKEVSYTKIIVPVVQDNGVIKIEALEISLILERDDTSLYQDDYIANVAVGPMYCEIFAVLIDRNYIILNRGQRFGGKYSEDSACEILTLMKQEALDKADKAAKEVKAA